jgi:hypothetical protein
MSNLLSTYTNSGPVAGGGGGGGSTLTYTTTTPERLDYTDIAAASGTFVFAASIPAGSRLVRIIWEVVTFWEYNSYGYPSPLALTAEIDVDGQLLTPMGSYVYTSWGTTTRKSTAGQGEIFGLNGGTGKLVECAPDLPIGGSPTTPELKWDDWSTWTGKPPSGSQATDIIQGEVDVSFEYLVIT